MESFTKVRGKQLVLFQRKPKIDWFSSGKAPYDVVKRLYGEDFIEERAIDIMIMTYILKSSKKPISSLTAPKTG
jgi:FKBP-type peptidyl-prolyl cis-trans isomerase (trigger factor)